MPTLFFNKSNEQFIKFITVHKFAHVRVIASSSLNYVSTVTGYILLFIHAISWTTVKAGINQSLLALLFLLIEIQ